VFTTALLEKFILFRPQGASHRSIESYDYTFDNFEPNKGGAQTMLKRPRAETSVRCNAHSYRAWLPRPPGQIRIVHSYSPALLRLGADPNGRQAFQVS